MLGPYELLVVALGVLLLFGKQLPNVMRSIGRGVGEFKQGVSSVDEELDKIKDIPRSLIDRK